MILFYVLIFIFGLFTGSFLNVVILRLKSKESFLWNRSHCPACKKTLIWKDLIPVLSFIFLRGRCRYCRVKISWQYPLVEIATGILFAAFLWRASYFISFFEKPAIFFAILFYYWFFASILLIIFVYDLKHYLILDKVIFFSLFLSLPAIFFMPGSDPIKAIVASIAGSAFLGAILLLTRGKGMGMGDVKLALLLGFITPWPLILLTFFLAFLIGAIFGLVLIFFKKKTLKSKVPLGTFLSAAAILTLLIGKELIAWYFGFVI